MSNRSIAIICLGAMAILCGCADPGTGTSGGAVSRSSTAQEPRLVEAPTHSFIKSWSMSIDLQNDRTLTHLYLRPGRLFAYTSANDVYAVDRGTGSMLFAANEMVDPGTKLWAPILLKDSMVFPGTYTTHVYSLKGDLLRTQKLPFSLTSNGCAGDGTLIYIGASVSGGGDNTAAGRLACVDTADAYVPEVWTLVTGGVTGNPAYASGVCFTGGEDGGVYAVDSGRHSAWSLSSSGDRFMTDAAVVGNVVVDGPAVFVSSMDTRLYSIDRLTGKLRWEYFAQAPLPDGPVVTLSNVYQLVPGTGMVAIARTPSAETIRHPAWTNADAVQVLAEDDRNVYLQMKDNSLQAANKNTGAMVWQSAPTNFVAYAPDLSKDGFFYAATADGRISQIKPVLSPGVIGEIVPQRAADQAPAAK